MNLNANISRRDFLKLTGLAAGSLLLPARKTSAATLLQEWPAGANLGRVLGDIGTYFELRSEPNFNAPVTKGVWRDDILEVKQVVIANQLDPNRYKQRWYETPDGFINAIFVQPVKNMPNQPLNAIPLDNEGRPGMWVEISVPKAGIEYSGSWDNASHWIKSRFGSPFLYYSQMYWASDIRTKDGQTQYLLNEKYGAAPDNYWADARACRPISEDEIAPIHPDVGDKKVLINLDYQTVQCFEGSREVYFSETSTGWFKEGKRLTPVGTTPVWRKLMSLHMSAYGDEGYDLPGVAWTTIFHPDGQAIHTAYWHNDFINPLSNGCINLLPHDAKWIWRWINPQVGYYPGELTVSGSAQSTYVQVVER